MRQSLLVVVTNAYLGFNLDSYMIINLFIMDLFVMVKHKAVEKSDVWDPLHREPDI